MCLCYSEQREISGTVGSVLYLLSKWIFVVEKMKLYHSKITIRKTIEILMAV